MMETPLQFLSLFAGIGGLDLGLERSGMRCIGQVEINPFCRRVLTKHWPEVPKYEDVRTVTAADFEGVRVDLIAGGFPCQDISNAGARIGITGDRSGLWSEFFRLICELRPQLVLVENVSALLERGLGTVLGDLASGGFDAEWRCYRASQFGASHMRDRLFIFSHRRECGGAMPKAGSVLADAGSESRWIQQSQRPSHPAQLLANCVDVASERAEGVYDEGAIHTGVGQWASEPRIGRVGYGLSDWMDRRCRLGNAVVPQVAEYIGRRIVAGVTA